MIYLMIFLISIAAAVLAKRNGLIKENRILVMVFVIEAAGAIVGAYDYYTRELKFSGIVERPAAGEGSITQSLTVSSKGEKENWDVTISETSLGEKQSQKLLTKAKKEIDGSLCSAPDTPDSVTGDLNISESYAGGMVSASWDFSEPKLISSRGVIDYDFLAENDPSVVYARAKLSCGEIEEIYEFPVKVVMPEPASKNGFKYYLNKALKAADETAPGESTVSLPDTVKDIPVKWSQKREYRGVYFCGLGLLAGAGIVAGEQEEKRRALKDRQRRLSRDYPEIVSALSLYVSAGITLRSAMTRIAESYAERRRQGSIRDRPGYEVIGIIIRQMQEGVGEETAYGAMGRLAGHKDYSKLGLMLSQSIKHGSRQLSLLLEKEEQKAFEARKLTARILGEEASTRLLIPMVMLLGVVLVILVTPAIFNTSI